MARALWYYERYNNSFSAINLLDMQGRRISIPMIGPEKSCLCSTRDEWWIGTKLRQGGPPAVADAVYQLPAEVGQVADTDHSGAVAASGT